MDTQTEITAHDLRLLSIGYYIQGGITAFYTLVMFGYFALVGTVFLKFGNDQQQTQIPTAVAAILSTVFAGIFLLCALYTVCIFFAGYWLRQRRNMRFIQVIAGLNCLMIPYGTVLGVFTFIVLARPAAKLFLFGKAEPTSVSDSSPAASDSPN